MKRSCSVAGCDRPAKSRGWCIPHYHRWRRHGDPTVITRVSPGSHPGCRIEGCGRKVLASALCAVHHGRLVRHGDPLAGGPIRRTFDSETDRFFAYVDRRGGDECWPWTAPLRPNGYGLFYIEGRKRSAHRFAYELANGPVPAGLVVDHTCHNADLTCRGLGNECPHRRCCNPAHLEAVTHAENIRRAR